MRKNKLILFYFSPVIIFFTNDIVMNYIRPLYGFKKYGCFSTILGWLPNYFAGFGFVLLGLIFFKFVIDLLKDKNYYCYIFKYMSLVAVLSATGLIWWEFEQKNGKLTFDNYDIYATIGGIVTGYSIFLILMLKGLIKQNDSSIEKTNP